MVYQHLHRLVSICTWCLGSSQQEVLKSRLHPARYQSVGHDGADVLKLKTFRAAASAAAGVYSSPADLLVLVPPRETAQVEATCENSPVEIVTLTLQPFERSQRGYYASSDQQEQSHRSVPGIITIN